MSRQRRVEQTWLKVTGVRTPARPSSPDILAVPRFGLEAGGRGRREAEGAWQQEETRKQIEIGLFPAVTQQFFPGLSEGGPAALRERRWPGA